MQGVGPLVLFAQEHNLFVKTIDNLQAWELLVITAHTQSLSRASIILDIDLPKASRLLRELEAELGFVLFDKSHRPISPTPRCAELVKSVEPLVSAFRGLDVFNRDKLDGKLEIRFAAPIELSRLFFSSALMRYSSEHPNVQFTILPEMHPDAVRAGNVDAAVSNRLPVDSTGLVVRQYHCSSTPIFATPEYLAAHGLPQTPQDLVHHTGLLQKTVAHDPTDVLYNINGSISHIRWKNTFMTHDQMSLKQLLLSHQGITVDLYSGHVLDELNSGRVVPILEGWEREPWTMCLITRLEDESHSPSLRAFAEWFTFSVGQQMRNHGKNAYLSATLAFERQRARSI